MFARSFCDITEDEISIIMQARKTLLFNNNEPWIKREGDKNFNIPMGCLDGAELSEITGTYMLTEISNVMNQNDVGLYRDDG